MVTALDRVDRLVPPGFDGRRELKLAAGVILAASAVLLLAFWFKYAAAVSAMYDYSYGVRRERPGAVFVSCADMLLPGRAAFWLVLAECVWLLVRYVSYHFTGGTKAMYTMRRIGRPGEFIARCTALPLAELVCSQLVWRVLALLMGRIYVLSTPERWLPPNTWESIVRLVTF